MNMTPETLKVIEEKIRKFQKQSIGTFYSESEAFEIGMKEILNDPDILATVGFFQQPVWVNINDRLPTESDAGQNGYVQTYRRKDRQNGFPTRICHSKWDKVSSRVHTHWSYLPSAPSEQTKRLYTQEEICEGIKQILFSGDPIFYENRGIDVEKRAADVFNKYFMSK